MKTALFATAYLPPLEYFMAIRGMESLLIEQYENFPKQTYRNRCLIAGSNGMQTLSIPVDKEGVVKVKTKDIKINYSEPWQMVHRRSIETAYNSSPFFLYYQDELRPFYERKFTFLLDFNLQLFELSLKWLGLDVPWNQTDAFIPPGNEYHDYRFSIHPKSEALFQSKQYYQVFSDRLGFIPNLSILDLLCNEGPSGAYFLVP
ncbi:MAG: WbqC family protein [Bacteroidetes bacterium]|nr:WbqC family protein [Bacteroidota bacterium]